MPHEAPQAQYPCQATHLSTEPKYKLIEERRNMTRSKYKHRKSGNGPYATRRSCGGPSRYSRTLHGVFVRAEPYIVGMVPMSDKV